MGLTDSLLGQLTSRFGISGDQAKSVLDKAVPFLQGKLGGLPSLPGLPSFGGDASRLYVSGHSSGAHLAGAALVTDWQKEFGLPADTVKGGLLCSGIYDLKPVRLSARSSYVKLTDEMEHALSTQRHLDRLNCPVVVAHGTLETPEFQRQTREFAAAVKAAGKPVQLLVAQGYNHFEIFETLASPYGLLGRAALEQMKLVPA